MTWSPVVVENLIEEIGSIRDAKEADGALLCSSAFNQLEWFEACKN